MYSSAETLTANPAHTCIMYVRMYVYGAQLECYGQNQKMLVCLSVGDADFRGISMYGWSAHGVDFCLVHYNDF